MSGSSADIIEGRVLEGVLCDDLEGVLGAVSDAGSTLDAYRLQDGSGLLHLCAVRGSVPLLKALLPSADPNDQAADGATALHLAAGAGRLPVVEALLEAPGIDDTITDNAGRTALELSRSKPVESAFQFARGAFVETTLSAMHRAVDKGDVQALRRCMQSSRARNLVDINAASQAGDTILHRAVKGGRVSVIKACLAMGADAFAKNRKGKMPLELTTSEEIRKLLKEAPMVRSREIPNESKLCGYLNKYVNFASGYKRRYVVLADGLLSYYKSKEDYPVSCKGSVNVQFARLVCPPGDRRSFELRTPKTTLYFKADSEGDARHWIMALGQWQRNLQKGETHPDAQHAADTLRCRSESSMAGQGEYRATLKAAHGCLCQLEAIQSGTTSTSQSGERSTPDESGSTVQQLIQSLHEFFRLCDEREQYWQGRLDAETRQRHMMEEALRQARKGSRLHYSGLEEDSSDGGEVGGGISFGDEFYDALDEEGITSEEGEEEEEMSTSTTPVSTTPTSTTSPSDAEALEELHIPERAVPAKDFEFIRGDLEGYEEPRRARIQFGSKDIPPISIWNIIKNAIGKDLTRIPVPVNFSEPISMLQRFCEDLEYADLLYMASTADDPLMRLQYIMAFAVSSYSTTEGRVSKPFNPLLGETFEYVSHEHGFRYIAEQVSHHPPVSACYCESARYIYYGDTSVRTKFFKSLELIPEGGNHVVLKDFDEHYSWRKVTTAVYNLILGKMWLDHYGTLRVTCHQTGAYCELEFKATGWRTSDPRRLEGTAYDAEGTPRYRLEGYWHRHLTTRDLEDGEVVELWRRRPVPPWSKDMYNFTYLAMTLNELTPALLPLLPPTDARLRPDQRAMEDGQFDDANEIKVTLEEAQRARRRVWEAIPDFCYLPRWFRQAEDPDTGETVWQYCGAYWDARQQRNWQDCLEIYAPSSTDSSEGKLSGSEGTSRLSKSESTGRLSAGGRLNKSESAGMLGESKNTGRLSVPKGTHSASSTGTRSASSAGTRSASSAGTRSVSSAGTASASSAETPLATPPTTSTDRQNYY